jgi:hypothetical protein
VTLRRIEGVCALLAGAYLVIHLAFYGSAAWGLDRVAHGLEAIARGRGPIDLALAAVAGIYAVATAIRLARGDTDTAFGEGKTRLYWTARLAGAGTLAFVAFHVWDQRLRHGAKLARGGSVVSDLAGRLATTASGVAWVALLFVFGSTCAAAHFAFECIRRANAREPLTGERRKRVQLWSYVVAALLVVTSVLSVLAFATGLRFGPPRSDYVPAASCVPK